VRLLLNRDATRKAVSEAILEFLKKAHKDDLALVFFSGHGAVDPARPGNAFFLCHDSDPNRLSPTAFPVWEIQNALDRGTIEARRLVLFADACHSGGFAPEGFKDLTLASREITEGLSVLARRDLVRVVTSCAPGERSQEKDVWGGGHGAFAFALVQGLSGVADNPRDKNSIGNDDGLIFLDELVHYVKRAVGDITLNGQHVQDAGRMNEVVKYLVKAQPATPVSVKPAETLTPAATKEAGKP
jgi:uncharacterized caspase-like protein